MIVVTLQLIPLQTLLFNIHAHTKDFITENNDHVKKVGSTLSTSARVEGLSVNTYKHPFFWGGGKPYIPRNIPPFYILWFTRPRSHLGHVNHNTSI